MRVLAEAEAAPLEMRTLGWGAGVSQGGAVSAPTLEELQPARVGPHAHGHSTQDTQKTCAPPSLHCPWPWPLLPALGTGGTSTRATSSAQSALLVLPSGRPCTLQTQKAPVL